MSSGGGPIDRWNREAARENPECTISVRPTNGGTIRWASEIPKEHIAHKVYHPRPLHSMMHQFSKLHSELSAEFYYAITWDDYLPAQRRQLELLQNVVACILRNRIELRDWHQS